MRKLGIAGLVAGSLVVGASFLVHAHASRSDGPDERAKVTRVIRRDIGTVVKATGIIKPRVGAEVRVGSRVSGVVRRLYVQVGDTVERGQLLAELDDRDLAARREQAAADLQRSLAELRYAESDLHRQRQLRTGDIIAPAELDLAERARAVAEQQVAVAKAALTYATTQLDYARIVAPIAGVVASVSTQEGETVAASFSAPTFVTLIDLSRLEVWAYVDETDIGRIEPGQKARFTVDTYPNEDFEGDVTTVYPKAEIRDNVVDYVTVVRFEPPRNRVLRPEMTTTVRIALAMREKALSLPVSAVRWEGSHAFVVVPRGTAFERRAITTGSRDSTHLEVVAGLREGDAVCVGDPSREGENKP